MPRDTRLTLWPEQMAYYPLISSWADIKKKDTLDFSECLGVHSCGLTATLLMTLFIFNNYSTNISIKNAAKSKKNIQLGLFRSNSIDEWPYKHIKTEIDARSRLDQEIKVIVKNSNAGLMQDCADLNFFNLIKDCLTEELQHEYCGKRQINPIESDYFFVNAISYPIFRFNFADQKLDRRNALQTFSKFWCPIFKKLSEKYNFKWNQFLSIIYEIAKNSADHTDNNAYMGVDIITSKNSVKICVLIGDLGPGIYIGIRNFQLMYEPNRKGKTNFSEAYRYALKKGFTTKKGDKSRNKGLGMPFIVNNSIAIGVRTSIVDAKSRLILSSLKPILKKGPSHNEIWRISNRIDGKRPFFYYLEYEAQVK